MTATATGNYVCDNSSLANFKSWAQAISGAFSAFGWTQTSDTGQVNWGSIASVPSSTYVYEVWKAADALAATLPIYVKIYYGFSSTSPRFQFDVGTSSDGSGNISGTKITSGPWQVTPNNSNNGATTYPCYFSGSTGEFRMAMWSSASPAIGAFFMVERSKDGSGANTADYFTVACFAAASSGNGSWQQTIKSGSAGLRDIGIPCMGLTSGAGTGFAFATVAAFPCFPVLGVVGNPFLGLMTVFATDVANNTTCTVASMYGSTHTFVSLSWGSTQSVWLAQRSNSPATPAALMRYE